MDAGQSLIAELEDAIQGGAPEKRVDTLRRITDLFVAGSDRFNDQQIGVFDDVLGHLIKRIEGKALVELSRRLGPIQNAPSDTLRRLAHDNDIAVAEPILAHSARLSDDDLIEIANTKTQAHLLAISGRSHISTPVTDSLLQRGDQHVFHKLAGNSGANFSANGFTSLVQRSEQDEQLAEKVGLRFDIPAPLFQELLSRATESVRSRLLAVASPERRNHIQRVLEHISEDVRHEAGFESERDYAEAHARIFEMHSQGRLKEATLYEFVKAGRHADMIAALALLCGAPLPLLDSLLQSAHREAVLVVCKAAGLEWPTVRAILNRQSAGGTASDQDLERARVDYSRLSQSTARRVLRFWQVRKTASVTGSIPAAAAASDGSGPQNSVAKINTA